MNIYYNRVNKQKIRQEAARIRREYMEGEGDQSEVAGIKSEPEEPPSCKNEV